MKLDTPRTLRVGFAFLSICAFWQLYDNVVPLVLKETFHMPDGPMGIIMALDNILALFLLPFFGALSDKTSTRFGRRTPYIVGGTLAAVVLMNLLPIADATRNFTLFIAALALLLLAMGTYRSPAVALMPDVTPKPLRSKGNAIINLMGALGGVYTLAMTGLLVRKRADGGTDYALLFLAVAGLMVAAVVVLLLTVRENRLAAETASINEAYDAQVAQALPEYERQAEAQATQKARAGLKSLSPEVRRSLLLILASVFFWFMGYNAVTTAFTKYVAVQWGYDIKAAAACLMVATVAAVLSYIPVGMLSARFGRKRMIQAGVILLTASFAAFAMFRDFSPALYGIFGLVGIAWATINVNSYPMVVEISKTGDVGQFTGYYYTFSMAAQIVTPILSGYLMQYVGYQTLAPYAALMVAISFVTISLTRHGDAKPQTPASKLESFDVGDD
ncbi:MAG: MFS transporter [Candidatus Limiplasma sp.]|nr:MFS transporter [Candidatus Limiplasma sp.]MEA5144469.1 MFS transporter [Candidatus Limiplasma sp.]